MNKNIRLILVGVVAVGLLAACSPSLTADSGKINRSINVSGTGRVTIVPDIAKINIGVRTESETVTDALDDNNAKANVISEVLQDLGVAEEDIQTSNFNIYPSDQYNPMTGQVEGRKYVVENTVNVTVRDLNSLARHSVPWLTQALIPSTASPSMWTIEMKLLRSSQVSYRRCASKSRGYC